MIPLIVAGGVLAGGALLFSKSDGKLYVEETTCEVPASEVPAEIREKFKRDNDALKGRRIPTDEVPADVREQARKDKKNRRMK